MAQNLIWWKQKVKYPLTVMKRTPFQSSYASRACQMVFFLLFVLFDLLLPFILFVITRFFRTIFQIFVVMLWQETLSLCLKIKRTELVCWLCDSIIFKQKPLVHPFTRSYFSSGVGNWKIHFRIRINMIVVPRTMKNCCILNARLVK